MKIFVVLMRTDSNGEQYDNYVKSFTEYSEATDFIRKENGYNTKIHWVGRDYDGFHYYNHDTNEERFDSGIYGILTEEIK